MNVDMVSASPVKTMRAALAELRVLEAAATPGDWCVDEGPTGDGATLIDADDTGACFVAMILNALSASANAQDRADAAFIVAAVAFARASLHRHLVLDSGGERAAEDESTSSDRLGLGSTDGAKAQDLRAATTNGDPLRPAVHRLLTVLQDARGDDEVTCMTQAGGYLLGDVMTDAIDDVVAVLGPKPVAPAEAEQRAQGAEEREADSRNGAVAATTYTAVIAETHVIVTSGTVTADSIEEALAKAKIGEILDTVVIGGRGVLDRTVEEVKVSR